MYIWLYNCLDMGTLLLLFLQLAKIPGKKTTSTAHNFSPPVQVRQVKQKIFSILQNIYQMFIDQVQFVDTKFMGEGKYECSNTS